MEGKQIAVFNADAYKVNPDASAEDLVTKMPGAASDAVEMTYALPALTRFERGVDFRKRPGRG